MEDREATIQSTGLRFLSKMTAANCHETKNALAIINENAGLLDDLLLMVTKGHALDPDRLQRLAANIRRQVARADHLAKSSHRLVHSVDSHCGPSDLGQSLELAVTLSARFAAMAEVELKIDPGPAAVSLPVSTFRLLNLIWLALEFALTGVQKGERLEIRMEKAAPLAMLRLTPLPLCSDSQVAQFRSDREVKALAEALACEIGFESQSAQLSLNFDISAGSARAVT